MQQGVGVQQRLNMQHTELWTILADEYELKTTAPRGISKVHETKCYKAPALKARS